jgi:hypothetical protein
MTGDATARREAPACDKPLGPVAETEANQWSLIRRSRKLQSERPCLVDLLAHLRQVMGDDLN